VHGSVETIGHVVVEQLPVVVAKVLFWAFADAIDKIAIAAPAMRYDAVFMTISLPNSGTVVAIPNARYHRPDR
jgi:hypothetical protein